jgi:predicted DNA-binding antitoxin AbrB/MazE fold protein
MSQAIRAIYHEGQLQLLDKVDLAEGQEIQLLILSDEDKLRSALGDLLLESEDTSDEILDEDALLAEIEEGFRGQPPLSQSIIDERQEGS